MTYEDYAYFTDEEWNETPRQRSERLKAAKSKKPVATAIDDRFWQGGTPMDVAPAKGTCPKCGKHIGRGVHFHAKACNG